MEKFFAIFPRYGKSFSTVWKNLGRSGRLRQKFSMVWKHFFHTVEKTGPPRFRDWRAGRAFGKSGPRGLFAGFDFVPDLGVFDVVFAEVFDGFELGDDLFGREENRVGELDRAIEGGPPGVGVANWGKIRVSRGGGAEVGISFKVRAFSTSLGGPVRIDQGFLAQWFRS